MWLLHHLEMNLARLFYWWIFLTGAVGALAQTKAAYLLFPGTISPDGRYAVGWAMPKHPEIWEKIVAGEDLDDDINLNEVAEDFVIDLKSKTVAGKLGATYWLSTKGFRGNHTSLSVEWSNSGSILTVISYGGNRWDPGHFEAALVKDGKVTSNLDVGAQIDGPFRRYLAKTGGESYKRDRKRVDVGSSSVRPLESDKFAADAFAQVPGPDTHEHFSADAVIRFSLTESPQAKLALKILAIREKNASDSSDDQDDSADADGYLNATYAALRLQLDAAGKDTLRQEQRDWLVNRDQITDLEKRLDFIRNRSRELENRMRKFLDQPEQDEE